MEAVGDRERGEVGRRRGPGWRLAVAAWVAFAALWVAPAVYAIGGFKTGWDLRRQFDEGEEGRALQTAYIAGVLDSERIVTSVAKFQSPICLPGGVPTAHLSLVVNEWLTKHPDRLDQQAANLVLTAVKEAFPCTKR